MWGNINRQWENQRHLLEKIKAFLFCGKMIKGFYKGRKHLMARYNVVKGDMANDKVVQVAECDSFLELCMLTSQR